MKAPQRILRRTVSYCVISSKYLTAVRPSFTRQNQTYPRCPTIRSPPPSPTSPPPYPHGRFSRHIRFTPCIALIYAPPVCAAPPMLFPHVSHHSVGLHLPVSRLCHPASPSAAYASISRRSPRPRAALIARPLLAPSPPSLRADFASCSIAPCFHHIQPILAPHLSCSPCGSRMIPSASASRHALFGSCPRAAPAPLLPPRGVSANIHSAYRKIFSTPLFLVSPSAQFSPSRAASHFFHRMNSVAPPLSPCWDVPSPLLTPGHPERRSILSLSYHFPALSCLFHNAVNTRFSHFVL